MLVIIIKMRNFMPVAKVTSMSPVHHGETLANDLKKIFTFYFKLSFLHNMSVNTVYNKISRF